MDKFLKVLEFDKLLTETEKFAKSEGGKREVLKVRPKTTREEVERELSITETFVKLLSERNLPLESFPDITETLEKLKVPGSVLSVDELLNLSKVLDQSSILKRFFSSLEERFERIRYFGERLSDPRELRERLNKTVDESGEILDSASPKLRSIRRSIQLTAGKIREKLQSIVNRNEDICPDRIITERDGRYVILAKPHFKKRFQGIVHDRSSSGQTLYVEPLSVVSENNRLRELRSEEREEIGRILREISQFAFQHREEISENFRTLTEIDKRYAVAYMSLKLRGTKPEIGSSLNLKGAKHPLLILSNKEVVPVDVRLSKGLVITGPNTGGKTVTLKTVGLLSLMAQSGFLIPAVEGSSVKIFKKWFADIGDEQSIEQSLSTFSAHIKNISQILKEADSESLVLLDELGAGTDPIEGSTLAVAILSYLKEKGAKTVATTHFTPVKLFAYRDDYYDVATVLFDEETLKPLYKLAYGIIGRSYALVIAEKYGIPQEVIRIARGLLTKEDRLADDILKALEEEYKRLERERREVERLRRELERREEELRRREREVGERLRRELSAYIEELERKTEEALREREAERAREKFKKVVVSVKNRAKVLSEVKPKKEVKEGDTVRILSSGRKGKVISVDRERKTATVQIGGLKVEVKLSQLEPTEEAKKKAESVSVNVPKPKRFFPELKVLGMRGEEALRAVEKFLDDANIVGVKEVKIVHGYGEGILKRLIREYLRESPYVKKFRSGKPEEGGDGVTVVELR
ncbi:MAG: endonuclease MutS2 [Thermovibrio sp.]|nr:MAG: endonuclease MutS2 [Thermovibrio sp.]